MPHDAIVIGAGTIGLSVALELRKRGVSVAIFDRNASGREASFAAGGMIADLDPHLPHELAELAHASAALYPTFVANLVEQSGRSIDFRPNGTIAFVEHPTAATESTRPLAPEDVQTLEPELVAPHDPAYFMKENAVDPRDLAAALLQSCGNLGVEIHESEPVVKIAVVHGRATGIETATGRYPAAAVINCAGAWAAQIAPVPTPTRPVKGQMLALRPESGKTVLQHVVRARFCYILPRSNGRLVVGSTVEPGGFDKTLNGYRLKKLHEAAAHLVPALLNARVEETWCGLRPGTPDNLPILGGTSVAGYFACTGHYRDGILLAPVSAQITADLVTAGKTSFDLSAFATARFPH